MWTSSTPSTMTRRTTGRRLRAPSSALLVTEKVVNPRLPRRRGAPLATGQGVSRQMIQIYLSDGSVSRGAPIGAAIFPHARVHPPRVVGRIDHLAHHRADDLPTPEARAVVAYQRSAFVAYIVAHGDQGVNHVLRHAILDEAGPRRPAVAADAEARGVEGELGVHPKVDHIQQHLWCIGRVSGGSGLG